MNMKLLLSLFLVNPLPIMGTFVPFSPHGMEFRPSSEAMDRGYWFINELNLEFSEPQLPRTEQNDKIVEGMLLYLANHQGVLSILGWG
jgi:hypothetical protein